MSTLAPLRLTEGFDERRLAHFKGLEAINARFYQRFASSFHQTRGHGWPGWRALLEHLPQRAISIYDIACGNGRLTELLEHVWCAERQGRGERYVGVDRDLDLLTHAQERARPFSCQWGSFNWATRQDSLDVDRHKEIMMSGSADWVTLFGVLHHVYSFSARVALICASSAFLIRR